MMYIKTAGRARAECAIDTRWSKKCSISWHDMYLGGFFFSPLTGEFFFFVTFTRKIFFFWKFQYIFSWRQGWFIFAPWRERFFSSSWRGWFFFSKSFLQPTWKSNGTSLILIQVLHSDFLWTLRRTCYHCCTVFNLIYFSDPAAKANVLSLK